MDKFMGRFDVKKYANKLRGWLNTRDISVAFAIIFALGLIMRLCILAVHGPKYNMNNDDCSYFNSGLHFFKTGEITMRGDLTAQIMPGVPMVIAAFMAVFGTGTAVWMALNLFWITVGMLSVLILYRTVKLFAPDFFACLSAAFLSLSLDFAYLSNVFMTETLFIFCFISIIYCTIRLGIGHSQRRHFLYLFLAFFGALLLRPVIAFLPVLIIVYLVIKKYPIRRLAIQTAAAAAAILLIFILPWSVRNHRLFGDWIMLSYGSGNPVLLGTYQGYGYPDDNDLNIEEDVYDPLPEQFKLEFEGRGEPHMTKYRSLQYDGMVAKYRMKQWWSRNPVSMLVSYAAIKPVKLLFSAFNPLTWEKGNEIVRWGGRLLLAADFTLMLFGLFGIFKRRVHRAETGFILLIYGFWIAVNSYAYAMARYAQAAYFLRFILLGWGLYQFFLWLLPHLKRRENLHPKLFPPVIKLLDRICEKTS